jgi:hypothetical protein
VEKSVLDKKNVTNMSMREAEKKDLVSHKYGEQT